MFISQSCSPPLFIILSPQPYPPPPPYPYPPQIHVGARVINTSLQDSNSTPSIRVGTRILNTSPQESNVPSDSTHQGVVNTRILNTSPLESNVSFHSTPQPESRSSFKPTTGIQSIEDLFLQRVLQNPAKLVQFPPHFQNTLSFIFREKIIKIELQDITSYDTEVISEEKQLELIHKYSQRLKQIMIAMTKIGFKNWYLHRTIAHLKNRPEDEFSNTCCLFNIFNTPKRNFDNSISYWYKKLHCWDNFVPRGSDIDSKEGLEALLRYSQLQEWLKPIIALDKTNKSVQANATVLDSAESVPEYDPSDVETSQLRDMELTKAIVHLNRCISAMPIVELTPKYTGSGSIG